MGRKPCCAKEGLNRGAWTTHEDHILMSYINTHGEGKWRSLPKRAGLKRCGKSCRLRWLNYLRPGIKRGNISNDEEELIIRLHKLLGNRWSLIAGRLPGRTDNEIKNYWNTTLGKKAYGKAYQPPKPCMSNNSAPGPAAVTAKAAPDHTAVVQTKAQRCTKTFFHRDQALLVSSSTHQQHLEPASKPSMSPPKASPDAPGDVPLTILGEEDEDPCFSMSLDGKLLLSGLSTDFWMESDCLQPHVEFNLSSVAAFLDEDDDWLNWTPSC
ncbi:hypothetical protein B296_00003925 [Ensete ventricosum]|uniref:Uncharacterized protein n=1 Tax=Ensete ventricosum TaxID=4639 RepID=A0A427APJ0_ENSVE|nr:hypothetical protein B296_00003925 [Ensete ventricosum]